MIRPDLKDQIKSFKDLKGKVIASNGTGSVSTYEVGKMLEREGLTIADVEIKVIPFPQMAVAFANKAIDAAIVIPPFVWSVRGAEDRGAVRRGRRSGRADPMTIAVIMVNTDWAKQNKELLKNYFIAWLRGVRDYCQGFHGGTGPRRRSSTRWSSSGTERRPELLAQISLAGAQPERPGQHRQHARHPVVVRQEQDDQRAVPGRAADGHAATSRTRRRSSGRSWSRTRTASIRAAAERRERARRQP